jgi:Domain of unknown function (DUF4352)
VTHKPVRPQNVAGGEESPPASGKRARWPWVAAGLAAVVLGTGSAAWAMSADPAPTVVARSATEGTFELAVTGSRCGVAEVGPADLAQRATGKFCLVDVKVKNTGPEAVLLDSGAQRAVDVQGRSYPVANAAAVFLNEQRPSLLDEIAAGAEVRGVLPFDVPHDVVPSAVVLHEAVGSAGAPVPLA